MTGHEEFATWDAAYVLGALSPAERLAYEAHLRECERCSEALAELTGVPGILSRVSREDAFALLDADADTRADAAVGARADAAPPQGPAPDMLPALLHRARRRRVRSRWLVAGLSAAAAAVLVGFAAFVLPPVLQPPAPTPAAAVVMKQVEPSPLSADVRLTAEPWGTRIDSRCSYARVGGDGQAWTYAMVVTDRSGTEHEVSTWTAGEGTTATPTATTSVPIGEIASVDIRAAGAGTVLLRSTFE